MSLGREGSKLAMKRSGNTRLWLDRVEFRWIEVEISMNATREAKIGPEVILFREASAVGDS